MSNFFDISPVNEDDEKGITNNMPDLDYQTVELQMAKNTSFYIDNFCQDALRSLATKVFLIENLNQTDSVPVCEK